MRFLKTIRKKRILILILLLILWIAIIFGFSLRAGISSHRQSGTVRHVLSALGQKTGIHIDHSFYRIVAPFVEDSEHITTEDFVRKAAHFTEYFALGLLCAGASFALRRRKKLFFVPLLFALPVSLTDEMMIQRFLTAGRTPSLKDALLDCIGFYCAVLIFILFFLIRRSVRKILGSARSKKEQNSPDL